MTTTAVALRPGERARAYARLAKLSFYDYYLSALVAWTLLAGPERLRPRTLLTLLLVTLGWVGVVAATVTFDDVAGFSDGSDQRNYAPGQGSLRNRSRKPLLDGLITPGQAIRFGYAAVLWAAVFLALTGALAPHRPAWVLALLAFVLLSSVQYSYGLKLSYRGGQELVLLLATGLTVLIPYGLLTGSANGLVLLESWLFGLWSLLVSVYSNINDLVGDRAAGRRNLATRTSPASYRVLVAALSAAEWVVVLLAIGTGLAPWWLGLLLVPVLAIRARQAHSGLVAGRPLVARKLGIQAHRAGVVLLLVANFLITR
jgi:1,4-dihydroxy-2-naphthoate octaprenyltransferase